LTNDKKFTLCFELNKSLTDLNSTVKDLKISKEVPKFLKDLDLPSGVYAYGVASTEQVDDDGDKVVIPDDILKDLQDAPRNKMFVNHNGSEPGTISAGTVEFSGRIPEVFGEDAVVVTKFNEAHPNFKEHLGSVSNGNLDSYTVGGSNDISFEVEDGKTVKVRTATELNEVSLTSFPANTGAGIEGMFFVKCKKGGLFVQEEGIMKTEELEKTLKEFGERLDSLEGFKKNLEEKKEEETTEEKVEEKVEEKTEEKAEETTEEKAEETEDDKTAELEKKLEATNKKLSDLKKSLSQSKRTVKDDTVDAEKLKKTMSRTPIMDIAKGGN